MRTIDEGIDRVRSEYLEMPGLRLKVEQVQRLCGIERRVCEVVLNALVDAKFLCLKDGRYGRLTEGRVADVRRPPVTYIDARSRKAS
jgi:hypothetical protein